LPLQCENTVKELRFPHTSIWQPGLLGRGDKARFNERMFGWLTRPIPTATVARAMVADAEAIAAGAAAQAGATCAAAGGTGAVAGGGDAAAVVQARVFTNKGIYDLAK
jgi:hypothetical protein